MRKSHIEKKMDGFYIQLYRDSYPISGKFFLQHHAGDIEFHVTPEMLRDMRYAIDRVLDRLDKDED
jgi:hypothetical protein